MVNDNKQSHTMIHAFGSYSEGNHPQWKKIVDVLPELAEMGITAMWLPPPTKPAGRDSVRYDIYDLYDLGDDGMRTKYGTKEELFSVIKKAKELRIVTYIDALLIHGFGAERTLRFDIPKIDKTKDASGSHDIKRRKSFSFFRRRSKVSPQYPKFEWKSNHSTDADDDNKIGKPAIEIIHGGSKNWAQGVDDEDSNYGHLKGKDIDHTGHPDARKDVIDWRRWVIMETGFRYEPEKRSESHFITNFAKAVFEDVNDPYLFVMGEHWKDDLSDFVKYLDSLGTQFGVFDTPLHYHLKKAGESAEEYDMRAIWDSTIVQKRPIAAVTLLDNPDPQYRQKLKYCVLPAFRALAYALILLRPSGYPCVFWGDLYGTEGDNPQQPVPQLDVMIRARNLYAHGELRDYWDHMNCVGWVRMGKSDEGQAGCAVVLCNGSSEGSKRMDVGKEHAGEKWKDLLGWYQGEIVIEDDGWAEFKCSARSVSIWVKEGAGKE